MPYEYKQTFLPGFEGYSLSSPPGEKGDARILKLKIAIEEKAIDKTTPNLHRVLLKDKTFVNYIFSGLIGLDQLPQVEPQHVANYRNVNIQKLVFEKIFSVDQIPTITRDQLLKGNRKLEEMRSLEAAKQGDSQEGTSKLDGYKI